MLIKQWGESQAARHVLADEDEYQQEPLVPQVSATLENPSNFRHVLVVPNSMAVLLQCLPKTNVGSISIIYPEPETTDLNEEFDDEEQLYSAANIEASRRKYPASSISLYSVDNASVLAVAVPHFANPIAEKKVASCISTLAPNASAWFALAPCQLNNGTTIGKLELSPTLFATVPSLKPPHFITGISAAVISALGKSEAGFETVGALGLNSEGHPGFEKVDADAIMDAARTVFGEILGSAEATDALQKLSGIVRKINSSSTSGMYL